MKSPLIAVLWLCFASAWRLQAHTTPLEAGAFSTNQNARLFFVNGGGFETNSLHYRDLLFQSDGLYPGLFVDELAIVAVPATSQHGGPGFRHAALGANLELMVQSVSGPSSATLSVWEESGDGAETTLRFEVPVGTTNGRSRIVLSQNNGSPGSDPFGYFKNRRVTVTQPGLYVVGFILVDTSSNGTGNGPIHQPSFPFYMYFQAGLTIDSISRSGSTVSVTIPALIYRNHFIEATGDLSDPNSWSTILGPMFEDDPQLKTYTITNTPPGVRFFRLRVEDP